MAKKSTESWIHEQNCCFANLNLFLFELLIAVAISIPIAFDLQPFYPVLELELYLIFHKIQITIKQDSYTKANESGEEAQKETVQFISFPSPLLSISTSCQCERCF